MRVEEQMKGNGVSFKNFHELLFNS